jgi:hypothetical protein
MSKYSVAEPASLNWMTGVPAADGGPPRPIADSWDAETVEEKMGGAVHAFITDARATVLVPGLTKPLKILHLSDSHVDGGIDSPSFGEDGYEDSAFFMHELYGKGLSDRSTGVQERDTTAIFRAQVAAAGTDGTDLIIHTGDLINCPSPASVEIVTAALADSGVPHLYVSGNHDWQFDALTSRHPEATQEELRAKWIPRHLQPLYHGKPLTCWSQDIAGLRFIGVDNSTYQVSESEFGSFKELLASAPGRVAVLCHVPLYSQQLLGAMTARGLPAAHGYLCGDPESSTPDFLPTEHTSAFLDAIQKPGSPVIAVFAGHIHTPQSHCIRGDWAKLAPGPMPVCLGCMQYVTDAGCFGGSRTYSIEPTDSEFTTRWVADLARRQAVMVDNAKL